VINLARDVHDVVQYM